MSWYVLLSTAIILTQGQRSQAQAFEPSLQYPFEGFIGGVDGMDLEESFSHCER